MELERCRSDMGRGHNAMSFAISIALIAALAIVVGVIVHRILDAAFN
jgi:hypothetical protein